jgi:uncharacterized protein YfaQ (DUF2300 family)
LPDEWHFIATLSTKKTFALTVYTVQKGQHLHLVSLMQRESILYVTDTVSINSFLADFYALYASASLEYTVQKEQDVHLVSLMQREIILYMARTICVS